VRITTGIGTAWPSTSACWRESRLASTDLRLELPLTPVNTASMSLSSFSSAVTRVPIWLITSASIDEGR